MDGRKKNRILRQLREVSQTLEDEWGNEENFNTRQEMGRIDADICDIIKRITAFL